MYHSEPNSISSLNDLGNVFFFSAENKELTPANNLISDL
jgi:hypothetical protein